MKYQRKEGFTLVEIMIVVVIIGLLAAMAIPAFKKVRESSIAKTIVNDGRQIGGAAQQYFMESGRAAVTVTVESSNGAVGGPLSDYVQAISPKLTFSAASDTVSAGTSTAFTLSHGIGDVTFNDEGKATKVINGGVFDGLIDTF